MISQPPLVSEAQIFMEPLVEKLKKTLEHYQMVLPGDKILVAVSGGSDSVALLHLLYELKTPLRLELCIAHLNHLTRGKDSDDDAGFVSLLGEKLQMETFIEAIDARKEQAARKKSFQETARILRYRFLEKVLQKTAGTKIALGHTADDQAETVIMNLLRGTGLQGLTGIPPVRGRIIRPLIECFHSEAKTFLQNRGLAFRSDLSNNDPGYLRNRIRADLIPKLQAEYNKNIQAHIVETAKILSDDEAFLTTCTEKSFQDCFLAGQPGSQLALSLEKIEKASPALQKRLVRQAVFFINNHLLGLTAKHIHQVVDLVSHPRTGKTLQLPGQVQVICHPGKLAFSRKPKNRNQALTQETPKTELKIFGATEGGKIRFITKLCSPADWGNGPCPANQAFLDFDKTGSRIFTRFFLPGDRFIPLGMAGTKKLKAFFIDEKIPREQRKKIPILTTSQDDIIWVFGQRISNTYRITAETKKILIIEGILLNNV